MWHTTHNVRNMSSDKGLTDEEQKLILNAIESALKPSVPESADAIDVPVDTATAGAAEAAEAATGTTDTSEVEMNGQKPNIEVGKSVPKKVSSKRCSHSECRKRLKLTDYACKCGTVYCAKHRYAEAHDCEFDYVTDARQKAQEERDRQKKREYYSGGHGGTPNMAC